MSRYRYDAKTDRIVYLDEKTGKWKPERKKKGKDIVCAPMVMSDIAPFVSRATEKAVEITSRSQLRRYERSNGIKQCGDLKPGEVIATEKKRKERDMREASRLARETRMNGKAEHFKWV